MKKYLALLLAVLMLTAMFAGCASKETTTDTPAASTETAEPAKTEETKSEEPAAEEAPASEEGKVFNIYAWNEEGKPQQHAEGNAETGIVSERRADGCAEAHAETHAFCAVVAERLFAGLFLCGTANGQKHQHQSRGDPWRGGANKSKDVFHYDHAPSILSRRRAKLLRYPKECGKRRTDRRFGLHCV